MGDNICEAVGFSIFPLFCHWLLKSVGLLSFKTFNSQPMFPHQVLLFGGNSPTSG